MNNNFFSIIFGGTLKQSGANIIRPSKEYRIKTNSKTIMITLLSFWVYFFAFHAPASSQVIHQSFELGERKHISIDLEIPYHVKTWAGNTVLTETNVKMENIAPNILKHFIDKGRYKILEDKSESMLKLILQETNRRPIHTKNGEVVEEVMVRVFVPEDCRVSTLGKGFIPSAEEESVSQTGK